MWWRNYSQTLFWKTKIEYISGAIAESFLQFVVIVYQVVGYRNILKLICTERALTSFLQNKK